MKTQKRGTLYKDLAFDWLMNRKKYVKESTYASYTNIIYNHLIPDFGNHYLNQITHTILQDYILEKLKTGNKKTKKGLSEKTVKDIMMVAKSILRYGMSKRLMKTILLTFSYPKNQRKTKIYTLTKREQRKLTQYILENMTPRNIGILISLYSGIRIGELCALTWKDIEFKNNTIRVEKTLQRIYIKENDKVDSKIIITSPKTATSNREIPMSKDFAEMLRPYKMNPSSYVLTSTNDCLEPRTYRKHFYKIQKILKVKMKNFHALRHTFATNCIRLGVDPKTVSDLLGHSDIKITLNLYVHPQLSQKKKCMTLVWNQR